MKIYTLNGQQLDPAQGFKDDAGNSYPPYWLMLVSDAEAIAAGVSVQTVPTPPPAPKTQFTSLEFLDRFTEPEQLAVVTATLASPAVKLWYDKMLAASFVDLEDPRTPAGIDALIAAGLIDASRRDALLAPEAI